MIREGNMRKGLDSEVVKEFRVKDVDLGMGRGRISNRVGVGRLRESESVKKKD